MATKAKSSRSQKLRRILGSFIGWSIAFLPLALVLFFWHRSKAHSDYGAFFTPSGNIEGIASHQGNMVIALTSMNFGRERGLTLLGDDVSVDEFAEVYDLIFTNAPDHHDKHRFGYAQSKPGDSVGKASHFAVQSPMWAVAILCLVPPLVRSRNRYRAWRRNREGYCLVCGYDLRASTGRCPECGTPVPVKSADGAAAS